nr:MAG TPA: hypothetical protein [Caudoviricetes sp.]
MSPVFALFCAICGYLKEKMQVKCKSKLAMC